MPSEDHRDLYCSNKITEPGLVFICNQRITPVGTDTHGNPCLVPSSTSNHFFNSAPACSDSVCTGNGDSLYMFTNGAFTIPDDSVVTKYEILWGQLSTNDKACSNPGGHPIYNGVVYQSWDNTGGSTKKYRNSDGAKTFDVRIGNVLGTTYSAINDVTIGDYSRVLSSNYDWNSVINSNIYYPGGLPAALQAPSFWNTSVNLSVIINLPASCSELSSNPQEIFLVCGSGRPFGQCPACVGENMPRAPRIKIYYTEGAGGAVVYQRRFWLSQTRAVNG